MKIQINLSDHRSHITAWTYFTLFFLNYFTEVATNCMAFFFKTRNYAVDPIKLLAYIITVATNNLVMYQQMFASLSIRERFKILNRNLSYYFPSGQTLQNSETEGLTALHSIVDMHDHLAGAILLVNSTFTFQVFNQINTYTY